MATKKPVTPKREPKYPETLEEFQAMRKAALEDCLSKWSDVEIERRIETQLSKHIDELILAALGMQKDSWGEYKIKGDSPFATLVTSKVGTYIRSLDLNNFELKEHHKKALHMRFEEGVESAMYADAREAGFKKAKRLLDLFNGHVPGLTDGKLPDPAF
jgi:hypothetical protein